MTVNRRKRLYMAAAATGVLIAVLIGTTAAQQGQDRKMVKEMMQTKVMVCVGRLVLDLPEDAQISFSKAQVGGVTIDAVSNFSQARAAGEVAARESALAGQLNEYERSSLEKREVISAVNFEATILYSGRKKPVTRMSRGQPVTSGEDGITVEAFGSKDDLFYRFVGKNLSSPKYEHNVRDLVTKFESRAAASVPDVPGFCTANGLIHDPIAGDDNETVTMFATLKSHPDVVIRLDTAVVDEPEESLLSRHEKNEAVVEFAKNITTLSKGARELNGLAGEEVLVRIKEPNGTTAHSFMWASSGKGGNVLAPSITLEMLTGRGRPGNPTNSSLSEDVARQLWQEISSSAKIRPVTSSKKVSITVAAPVVPLGELVSTGQPCPQTGYWQCTEVGIVEGGQRQFFTENNPMPEAVLLGAPSLWQKLSGVLPSHRVSTVWKFVGYEAPSLSPKRADEIESSQLPSQPGNDQGAV